MSTPVPFKYPLVCGCAGPKYLSMCEAHKALVQLDHRRLMGIIDSPHCPTCTCGTLPPSVTHG